MEQDAASEEASGEKDDSDGRGMASSREGIQDDVKETPGDEDFGLSDRYEISSTFEDLQARF